MCGSFRKLKKQSHLFIPFNIHINQGLRDRKIAEKIMNYTSTYNILCCYSNTQLAATTLQFSRKNSEKEKKTFGAGHFQGRFLEVLW